MVFLSMLWANCHGPDRAVFVVRSWATCAIRTPGFKFSSFFHMCFENMLSPCSKGVLRCLNRLNHWRLWQHVATCWTCLGLDDDLLFRCFTTWLTLPHQLIHHAWGICSDGGGLGQFPVAMAQKSRTLLLPLITSLFFLFDEALLSELDDYFDFHQILANLQPPSEKAGFFPTLPVHLCRWLWMAMSYFCPPSTLILIIFKFNLHVILKICQISSSWQKNHPASSTASVGDALHLRAPRDAGPGGLDFSLHQSTGMAPALDERTPETHRTSDVQKASLGFGQSWPILVMLCLVMWFWW